MDATFDLTVDCRALDGTDDFFLAFKEQLNFPDYMGLNWMALWECLLEDAPKPSLTVLVLYPESLKDGEENVLAGVLSTFRQVAEQAGSDDEDVVLQSFHAVVVSDEPTV